MVSYSLDNTSDQYSKMSDHTIFLYRKCLITDVLIFTALNTYYTHVKIDPEKLEELMQSQDVLYNSYT
jgi:hypothetical protein